MERTNSRINIPPPSVVKDELSIAGEKEGVMIAQCEINHIYETKVSCRVLYNYNGCSLFTLLDWFIFS